MDIGLFVLGLGIHALRAVADDTAVEVRCMSPEVAHRIGSRRRRNTSGFRSRPDVLPTSLKRRE
jgi:hypothetical protein